MKGTPIISILIPVYNTERYLERCIESAINQSIKEIEIILVDDGSTDVSGDICDRYALKDDRIKVIHKPNGGLASSRIAAINCAEGEWLGFLDSDDWIDSNMYTDLYECSKKYDDVDIVAGGYVEERKGHAVSPFTAGKCREMNPDDALIHMFEGNEYNWSLCDKLYRRALFSEDILSQWPHGYGEDTFINWHVFMKSRKVIYTPVYGYHYYINSESMMHKKVSNEKLDYFRIYGHIVDELEGTSYEDLKCQVMNVALDSCLPILFFAEEHYDSYSEKIKSGLAQMKEYTEYLDKAGALRQPAHIRSWLERVDYSRDEIQSKIKKRNEDLMNFAGDDEVYIYGAGKIAEEIIDLTQRLEIKVKGIVVSDIKNSSSKFFGHEVLGIKDLIDRDTEVKMILALNEKNSKEVIELLECHDNFAYFSAGIYSIYY